MDPKVNAFLELVRCRPDEVLDIPADRLNQPPQSVTASPEARLKSIGEKQIYFGKHKGKKMREVPTDYLQWALGEKAKDNSFRKFQRDAKEYLRSRSHVCGHGSVGARGLSISTRYAASSWRL